MDALVLFSDALCIGMFSGWFCVSGGPIVRHSWSAGSISTASLAAFIVDDSCGSIEFLPASWEVSVVPYVLGCLAANNSSSCS